MYPTAMKPHIVTALIAFLIGCAAAPLIVPQLRAQQAHVTRWEYLCLTDRSSPNTDVWNQHGAQGWEAIGSRDTGAQVCFKRPL